MHGAGNDFVVLDARHHPIAMTSKLAESLAARRLGIGCDQVIVMEEAHAGAQQAVAGDNEKTADIKMTIYNADGSLVNACGNATRCIGWLMLEELAKPTITIETAAGHLVAEHAGNHQVKVNMGEPRWDWRDIPLSEPRNTEHLGIEEGALMDPVAVSMGNPHMVFFVRDLAFVAMDKVGPKLEKHPLFPKKANVSAAQVIDGDHLQLKVWERGAGQTLACGTAACAAVVAGVRRKLCNRHVTVSLPGGDLVIEWRDDNQVMMTGPVAEVYRGEFTLESLA